MKNIISLFLLSLLFNTNIYAQENENEESEGNSHKIAFVFGYTYIPSAFEDGSENESVFVPTLGIDYFFQFAKGWKIGTVLDLELGDYLVDFGRRDLERERALVTGVLVGYEFKQRWSVMLGPGIEFEKNKNLFILRASVEYEFELGESWGLFPSINYDFKEEYDTWSINIGVSKRL